MKEIEMAFFRVIYREGGDDKRSAQVIKPFNDESFEQVFIQFNNITNEKFKNDIIRVTAQAVSNGRYEMREVHNGQLSKAGVRSG